MQKSEIIFFPTIAHSFVCAKILTDDGEEEDVHGI